MVRRGRRSARRSDVGSTCLAYFGVVFGAELVLRAVNALELGGDGFALKYVAYGVSTDPA